MKYESRQQRGFTLIELIVVVAIITTLAAIFIPLALDKISESSTARAQSDVDAIGAALTGFFAHVNNFPSCNAADCDPLNDAANNLRFLAVCSGTGSCNTSPNTYPGDSGALWNLAANQELTPAVNNAFNHLVANDPNADGNPGEAGVDYRTTRWKGPYIAKLNVDPFGSAYIIHVGAMQKNGCRVNPAGGGCGATGQGWILSAGPNGNLDTAPTDTSLGVDDIGHIFTNQ